MKLSLPLLFVGSMLICCKPPQNTATTREATFIFRATVENIGQSTLTEISDPSNCIIVKVNDVIVAPPGFTDWKGRSITVAVKGIGNQKQGQEKVFYTDGWLYGKSLAVVEINSKDSKEVTNEQVIREMTANQDKKVTERLKSSELVFTGEIVKIDSLASLKLSEHDPEWAIAVTRIDTVLKGKTQTKEIRFRFPTSDDVMWVDAPKFRAGQKGIWLLRRSTSNEDIYTITEKADYYPSERISYIRSLLK